MSYDLAISPNGDLMISGARDLQGVSGTALIEQRMRLRLRMARGQWQYDPDGRLGSQLFTLVGQNLEMAEGHAQLYVREALRDMDEIVVDSIIVQQGQVDTRSIEIFVKYHLSDNDGSIAPDLNLELSVAVPVGG